MVPYCVQWVTWTSEFGWNNYYTYTCRFAIPEKPLHINVWSIIYYIIVFESRNANSFSNTRSAYVFTINNVICQVKTYKFTENITLYLTILSFFFFVFRTMNCYVYYKTTIIKCIDISKKFNLKFNTKCQYLLIGSEGPQPNIVVKYK